MKRDDPVFLAWAAGFFDGEGTIIITMSRKSCLYLSAKMSQVVTAPLEEIRAVYGGCLHKRDKNSTCMVLTLGPRASAEFLSDIRPYCRVKCEEIDMALEFAATVTPLNRRKVPADIMDKRRELRARIVAFRARKYAKHEAAV